MATADDVRINIIADTQQAVKNMAAFAAGIGAAILVARKLINTGKEMVDAYMVQEQAEARLTAAIRATGREADISEGRLHRLASSLQAVTTYGDEATISAMAMLQQLADLDQQGLEKVTPAMLDFAAAMNIDLNTAASLIGRTLGSSTNALTRYGIELDASADPTEKLAQLTEELNSKFGGVAEAIGETTLGQMKQYENALGDIKEAGGELIMRGFNPLVQASADFLTNLIDIIEKRKALAGESGEGELLQALADDAFRAYSRAYAEQEKLRKNLEKRGEVEGDWIGAGMRLKLEEMEEKTADLTEAWYAADNAVAEYNKSLTDGGDVGTAAGAQAEETAKILEELDKAYRSTALGTIEATQAQIAYYESLQLDLYDAKRNEVVKELNARLEVLKKRYEESEAIQLPLARTSGFMTDMLIAQGNTTRVLADRVDEATLAHIHYNEGLEVTAANARVAADVEQTRIDRARAMFDVLDSGEDILAGYNDECERQNRILEAQADLVDAVSGAYQSFETDALESLGAMFIDAEKGAESFKDAAKAAIATVLRALGEYLTTMAVASLANPYLAAAYGVGAAAAYIAAGAVTALAEGGIVTRPTLALIGEAGPEAVVPLGKSGGGMGNNMQVNVYGNLLTERQLVDGILRRASNMARSR